VLTADQEFDIATGYWKRWREAQARIDAALAILDAHEDGRADLFRDGLREALMAPRGLPPGWLQRGLENALRDATPELLERLDAEPNPLGG
jgi:hypothetical protein